MKQSKVFLSLGSNLGDKKKILLNAVNSLKEIIFDLSCSSIYETGPLYYLEQPNFYNIVISGNTYYSSTKLLEYIKRIEKDAGRNRKNEIKKGPRTLDIDILLYNNLCIKSDELTIPHPGIEQRLFVLTPLLEIDKSIRNPLNGVQFSSAADKLENQHVKKLKGLF